MVESVVASNDSSPAGTALTVHDALVAARRALAVARAHASATAATEEGVAMADVLQALDARITQLAPGAIVSTEPWFAGLDQESAAMLLLALLELARLGTLWVYQATPGTALWIQKPAGPRQQISEGKRRGRSTQPSSAKKRRAS